MHIQIYGVGRDAITGQFSSFIGLVKLSINGKSRTSIIRSQKTPADVRAIAFSYLTA